MRWFIFLILSLILAGCRSEKEVVRQITVARDSVVIRDSIRIVDKVSSRDSVIMRDSVVTVVDDQGNILRTELYREKEKYKDLERDYMDLQDKALALYHEKNDTTYVEVEKQLSRWQNLKIELGEWMIALIVILVIFLIYNFARKK